MCGRFALSILPQPFFALFGTALPPDMRPRFNITPDQQVVAVVEDSDGRRAAWMRWGLLPPWAKLANDKARQINARSETVCEKRMFKDAVRRQRCVIPADGFYEWCRSVSPSQPFWIGRSDGSPLVMAGIWRQQRIGDELIDSCAILTTAAFESIRDIHHRMPVMLSDSAINGWLLAGDMGAEQVSEALSMLSEDQLDAHTISRRVNDPRQDDELLKAPGADEPQPAAQGSLF